LHGRKMCGKYNNSEVVDVLMLLDSTAKCSEMAANSELDFAVGLHSAAVLQECQHLTLSNITYVSVNISKTRGFAVLWFFSSHDCCCQQRPSLTACLLPLTPDT